jgi:hypothetical protein
VNVAIYQAGQYCAAGSIDDAGATRRRTIPPATHRFYPAVTYDEDRVLDDAASGHIYQSGPNNRDPAGGSGRLSFGVDKIECRDQGNTQQNEERILTNCSLKLSPRSARSRLLIVQH